MNPIASASRADRSGGSPVKRAGVRSHAQVTPPASRSVPTRPAARGPTGFPVRATKRYVDAVTAITVGRDRTWADADALLTAARDPECQGALLRYIDELRRRREPVPDA